MEWLLLIIDILQGAGCAAPNIRLIAHRVAQRRGGKKSTKRKTANSKKRKKKTKMRFYDQNLVIKTDVH